MTIARIRLGWALLFIGAVLAMFLLTTPGRASRRTASETPVQACALERAPAVTPEPCVELTQTDPGRQPMGETAWLLQC